MKNIYFIGCLLIALVLAIFIIALALPAMIGAGSTGLGLGAGAGGSDSGATEGATIPNTVTQLTVRGKEIILPATKGKTASEETPAALHAKGQYMTFDTQCDSTEEKWYMNMRWPYVSWSWDGHTREYDVSTKPYYAKVRVIVNNPRTKKTVVTAICESGPGPWAGSSWAKNHPPIDENPVAPYWTGYIRINYPSQYDGRVSGLAPAAYQAIGATLEDVLNYGFAEDQRTPLGPVK